VTTYARGLDLGEVIWAGGGRWVESNDPRHAGGTRGRHARVAGVRRAGKLLRQMTRPGPICPALYVSEAA